MIRAGAQLKLTDTGQVVTIWSPAPAPGTYWCHLGQRVVLVSVRNVKNAVQPIVTVMEEEA